ncbi:MULTISPECIES: F0F1 ATP synthase subunit A [unclassified Ekhidna]|jgi:F-type H+-transporting ATPase subunit a|uniref:F0F1 ATP synthase subunit A n=1 Tax=unclassified Ekhidna TaxID=2632188 RepID=UPI0032DF12D2
MKIGSILKQSNFLKINKFLAFLLLVFPGLVFAGSGSKDGEEGPFDPSELINHHISDSHVWEIYHGLNVYLPVIVYSEEKGLDVFSSHNFFNEDHEVVPYNGYVMDHDHITLENGEHVLDISITKNVLFMLIDAVILILVFSAVARGYKKNAGRAPKGIQSFFEPIIIFIRDDIAKENIGHKYERFMPFLLTVFFFIWFGNLLGLLPGAANMTGNISVTLTLAVITLLITLFSGRQTYWLHIVDPLGKSMPWAGKILLYIILWPVEIIGIFTKPFSLMIRLFANITAGHILILSIISLAFIFESLTIGVVGAVFATVMNMLELFVAVLQAYVFTLLSALYFGQAVEEHH